MTHGPVTCAPTFSPCANNLEVWWGEWNSRSQTHCCLNLGSLVVSDIFPSSLWRRMEKEEYNCISPMPLTLAIWFGQSPRHIFPASSLIYHWVPREHMRRCRTLMLQTLMHQQVHKGLSHYFTCTWFPVCFLFPFSYLLSKDISPNGRVPFSHRKWYAVAKRPSFKIQSYEE